MLNSLKYKTKTFTEVYETVNDFIYDYNNLALPRTISVENAMTLYYLLYAKYGNSPISNLDVNQFKYKLFGVIWQYGPTWEKKLYVQEKLREIQDEDLKAGAVSIYNHAFNPETAPGTTSREELTYINEQNTSRNERSAVGAYMELWQALSTDVTEGFLARFAICFKQFVGPEKPILYSDEDDD